MGTAIKCRSETGGSSPSATCLDHVVCTPTIEDAEDIGLGLCPATFGEIDVLAMPAGQAEHDLGPGWFDHESLALWFLLLKLAND